jgi:hypothetical protein
MKNKKIFISIIFLIILLLAALTSQANNINIYHNDLSKNKINLNYKFSLPIIKENNDGITVHINNLNQYLMIPGQPILPISMQKIELPLGTKIKDIICTTSNVKENKITKDVVPGIKPVTSINTKIQPKLTKNLLIYQNDSLFPENWYNIQATAGLNKFNEHTTFFSIQLNPIRYNPVKKTISSVNSINLEITFEEPTVNNEFIDQYDMIIICDDKYTSLLQPLVDHKNSYDIKTLLIPIEEIYNSKYFPVNGRDNPEKIKYFIKNAIENWNIKYVLLVGNFQQIPCRLTNLETDAGGLYEELNFVTDLYYADIYNSDGSFSSWDTDNDELYGEWPCPEFSPSEDIVDLVPDVYLGRLACMFKSEVKTMVDKIIFYENGGVDPSWFNKIILLGGDTFDKNWEGGTDYDEGEEANKKAIEYMEGFNPVKLWASIGNLEKETIISEINKGSGFLYFVGHGSPKSWSTHLNGDYNNWIGNFNVKDMPELLNEGKYPILMVGGCHNSEIDVTPINFIKGILSEGMNYFVYNENHFGGYYLRKYLLECWSWVFVKVPGGAIASIGSIGFGGVDIGDFNNNSIPDCIEGMDGWFENQFFKLYNIDNIDILGQTYSQTITDYVHKFPTDTDRYDCKVIETHILLGDPSLKIGGYQ